MMHKSMCGSIGPASVKEDVTLKDYIARKQDMEEPKSSSARECIKAYNRWMKEDVEDLMSDAFPEKTIWKAAWAAAMKHKENK